MSGLNIYPQGQVQKFACLEKSSNPKLNFLDNKRVLYGNGSTCCINEVDWPGLIKPIRRIAVSMRFPKKLSYTDLRPGERLTAVALILALVFALVSIYFVTYCLLPR